LIPIADCHTHTNPVSGLGMRHVAKKFRNAGGWFIALVSLPPSHYGYPPTPEGYVKAFNVLISEAKVAREHGLKVMTFAGIHPADVEKNIVRIGLEKTIDLIDTVLKLLEDYLRKGVIDGLGEFGRPHYRAMPEAFALNEYLTLRALELARDFDVPIHLHLEQKGDVTMLSVSKVATLVKIPNNIVIIHHVDTKTAKAATRRGFPYTALGRAELLKNVLSHPSAVEYTLVESDHIDDPKRPGVALYPWQIRNCIDNLLREGIDGDTLYKVMVDNVVKIFRSEPP